MAYENTSMFPAGGTREGHTVMYSAKEIEQGNVDGPVVFKPNKKYPIVDALTDLRVAIGLKEKTKEVTRAPRAPETTGYSGHLNYRDSERVGEVAYRMIRDEIEAAGYNVVELPEDDMLRRYNNANGSEDITVGGNTIYITKGRASEKKAEIAYHEYRAAELVKEKGGYHADYHPVVEKEQGPATEAYMRRAMQALMN